MVLEQHVPLHCFLESMSLGHEISMLVDLREVAFDCARVAPDQHGPCHAFLESMPLGPEMFIFFDLRRSFRLRARGA